MREKEFKAKFKNNSIILPEDAIDFLKSAGIEDITIKIIPDLDEICKKEKISRRLVEKISLTQKIPFEIALGLIRSKGKLIK